MLIGGGGGKPLRRDESETVHEPHVCACGFKDGIEWGIDLML